MADMVALAGCIICNDMGDVLMVHRSTPNRTQWEIPGGAVKGGGESATAAVRELKKELGIDVIISSQLGERQFTEGTTEFYYTWFLAKITAGEPGLKQPELFDKFGYISLVSLSRRYDELSLNTKSFLEAMAYGEIDLAV